MKVKIINCEQNSEEWYKVRLGVATASSFSRIITSTGKESTSLRDYAFELASEKLIIEQEERYISSAMERGHELEPEARQLYQELMLQKVDQVGFCLNENLEFGCSPDGFVNIDGLIEIKCPNQKIHTKYFFNNKLPTEYVAQVQGQLLVTNRNWCDFVSYNPSFIESKRLFKIRINKDEKYIAKLLSGLLKTIELKNKILTTLEGKL